MMRDQWDCTNQSWAANAFKISYIDINICNKNNVAIISTCDSDNSIDFFYSSQIYEFVTMKQLFFFFTLLFFLLILLHHYYISICFAKVTFKKWWCCQEEIMGVRKEFFKVYHSSISSLNTVFHLRFLWLNSIQYLNFNSLRMWYNMTWCGAMSKHRDN